MMNTPNKSVGVMMKLLREIVMTVPTKQGGLVRRRYPKGYQVEVVSLDSGLMRFPYRIVIDDMTVCVGQGVL